MNGRQFFRALANAGIPASIVAQRMGSNVQHLYSLKDASTVPQAYLDTLDDLRDGNRAG